MLQGCKRVLVIRQDRLGDVINAIPVLSYLRKIIPTADITFMTNGQYLSLLQGQAWVDHMLECRSGFRELLKIFLVEKYDALLMLKPSKRIAWAALSAGIKQKAGLGWRPYYIPTGFKPAHPAKSSSPAHEINYNISIAQRLFPGDVLWEPPKIILSAEQIDEAKRAFLKCGINNPIAILPANRGSSVNWNVEKYTNLIRQMELLGYQTIVFGAVGEDEILECVAEGTNTIIYGLTADLPQLAAAMSLCRMVIGSSTGTLHLASAVGTPTIGLFCPLPACSPKRWGPQSGSNINIISKSEKCDECQGRACNLEEISVELVIEAVKKIQ